MSYAPVTIRPKPGIQRDGTRFAAESYIDGQWSRFQRGGPRKMGGYRALTTLSEIPRSLHSFNTTGVNYVHAGTASFLNQVRVSLAGASPANDRTPTVAYTASADALWQFDTLYDPINNAAPTLYAHPGWNLTDIDNAVESPVYFGTATAATVLAPLSLPIDTSSFTVATFTATTAVGSPTLTVVSSTTNLRKGQTITGAGIPANTYILSVDSGTQITMSRNATAAAAGVSITAAVGGVSGGLLALFPYLMVFDSNGRVNWSTATDPNDFWGTGSGQAYITGQKIVRGLIARGGAGTSPSALLWTLEALIRVTFSGGSTTFNFDTVSDDITVLSSRSIVEVDGIYMWAGTDRFLMYNGVVREIPNTFNANWFFDNINYAARQKAFAFKDARWGEVWWCYPRGSATECTHAVVYNYREGYWYDTELPNSGRSCALPAQVYPYPIMGGVLASSSTYTLWQHNVGTDEVNGGSSVPVRAYIETNDVSLVSLPQNAQDKALSIGFVEPDFVQMGDMTVTVTGSANARASDVDTETHTFAATPATRFEQVVPCKSTLRQLRLRFTSDAVGGHYEMGRVIAHVQPADGQMLGA